MFVVVIHFRTRFIFFTDPYILVTQEILIVFIIETLEREHCKSVIIDMILEGISRFNFKMLQS